MTKVELRREMRARLKTLGVSRVEKSRAIVTAIAVQPAFVRAQTVALFDPLPDEPDLETLWEQGPRTFCYPRVRGAEMEMVHVPRLADLAPAAWHARIRESASATARVVAPAEIDLILVPGLTFTRAGQRLGRGGGFYDRLLARLSAHTFKIGVCFDAQIHDDLPDEIHDQRMNAVITETAVFTPLSA